MQELKVFWSLLVIVFDLMSTISRVSCFILNTSLKLQWTPKNDYLLGKFWEAPTHSLGFLSCQGSIFLKIIWDILNKLLMDFPKTQNLSKKVSVTPFRSTWIVLLDTTQRLMFTNHSLEAFVFFRRAILNSILFNFSRHKDFEIQFMINILIMVFNKTIYILRLVDTHIIYACRTFLYNK